MELLEGDFTIAQFVELLSATEQYYEQIEIELLKTWKNTTGKEKWFQWLECTGRTGRRYERYWNHHGLQMLTSIGQKISSQHLALKVLKLQLSNK